MTQPPPGPGYVPGYAPGPSAYGPAPHPNANPHAGYGNPYAPGPTGFPPPSPQPYPPAYPSPQWNHGQPVPNPNAYTPWLDRVLAWLIDQVPIFVILFVGNIVINFGIMAVVSTRDSSGDPSGAAIAVMLLATFAIFAMAFAYSVWNFGYRQGTTGQSIGKKALKFKVISEKTGQPIGVGMSLVRQIAHAVDSFVLCIGYLMPLWDPKRQTIADKIMTTVCVPAPVPPVIAGPQGGPSPYPYPPR